MTFRELTELQKKSQNAAYERNYAHRGNEWLESTGSRPEMDRNRRWMTRDGSRPEMDRGRIWIATGYGWMTGGG